MGRIGNGLAITLSCIVFSATAVKANPDQIDSKQEVGSMAAGTEILDAVYIDANNLLMFVSNSGNFARDISGMFGVGQRGFYYPYTGIADILNGTNDRTVLYDAGIWIGAISGTDTLVSVSGLTSEYIPGPMSGGTFQPDALSNAAYRVYKIHRDSTGMNANTDYDEWPSAQGAPTIVGGGPFLAGDQTLWTVFNDADPTYHTANAGSTAPLGIEIRQLVWATDSAVKENAVFIDYRLYNKGSNSLTDFYISFWFDPDIGGNWDDRVGCDTLCDMFFAYNGDGWDDDYGRVPAAFAGKIIRGPVVPSNGDTATYFSGSRPNYKNIGMTSFQQIIGGIDPNHWRGSYRYMAGLDASGAALANGTTYRYPGHPSTLSGDYDQASSDSRILVTCGPIPTFNPGDSQQVIIKLAASAQFNWMYSLAEARNEVDPTCSGTYPTFLKPDSMTATKPMQIEVYFEPGEDRWLAGADWGGNYFVNESADFGINFFGSKLNPVTEVDSFPTVELRFSNTITQKAYSYLRGGLPNYAYNGYHEVPFTAWDVDNNRQVNVAFVEWVGSDIFDSTWNVDSTLVGGREYLHILNSDYSGVNPLNSVLPYTTMTLSGDAGIMDITYALWPRLDSGHAFSELAPGQKLIFNSQELGPTGPADTVIFRDTKVGDRAVRRVLLNHWSSSQNSHSLQYLETTSPGPFKVSQLVSGCSGIDTDSLTLIFEPLSPGDKLGTLDVIDSVTLVVTKEIVLRGTALYNGPVWFVSTSGSDSNDGSVGSPFATVQHAIGVAAVDDTILVGNGTFGGAGNRDINFLGKNLVLKSLNGPGFTTLTGGGVARCFIFENGEGAAALVEGFTITGGFAGAGDGGAVRISGSSPTFRSCAIVNSFGSYGGGVAIYNNSAPSFSACEFGLNSAAYDGGAVQVGGSSPFFYDCYFHDNDAENGAGLYIAGSDAYLDSCTIVENTSTVDAGGIYLKNTSVTLTNCTIARNAAWVGGNGMGLFLESTVDSTTIIENCIIAYNYPAAGVNCTVSAGTLDVSCTDIYGNIGGDWSECFSSYAGINENISVNPIFCDTTGSDYSISSSSICSPFKSPCGSLVGGNPIGCVTDTSGFIVTPGETADLFYLATADMDRDNFTDLVYTGSTTSGLFIKFGETGGTFTPASQLLAINKASILITYLDSDTLLDIAAVGLTQIHILLNDGDRTFTTHTVSLSGANPDDKRYTGSHSTAVTVPTAATGFLDDDTHYDMVVAPNLILFGDGNGDFPTDLTLGFNFETVNTGDFNSDGWDDLMVTTADSALIYMNNQLGDFIRTSARYVGPSNLSLSPKNTLADLNYDGNLDYALVVPLSDATDQSLITWVLGSGLGGYILADSIRVAGEAYDLVAADANKDHILDIVIANGTTNVLEIYLGNGSGGFDGPIEVEMGGESDLTYVLATIDIDKDGNVDFVSGGLNEGSLVYAESQEAGEAVLVDEMVTTGYSNASLTITNPSGFIISQNYITVAGSEYWRHDVNNDDLLDEEAYDFNLLEGEYSITIGPRAGEDPELPFSVGIRIDGTAQVEVFHNYSTGAMPKSLLNQYAAASDGIIFYYTIEYPSSIQPANGYPTTNLQPTLEWTILAANYWPGAGQYHLQVDNDYYFGSPLIDEPSLAVSTYSLPFSLVPDAVYYWRVRADEGTVWSGYSRTFALYISSGCCINARGNANADGAENVNISDITYLVDYLFGIPLGPAPPCLDEGNANADVAENINISDITYLVDYLFGIPLGPAPPACP